MNATFVNADGTSRRVWIRLTDAERREARRAELLSWVVPWKCPADLMSGELEEILCGHTPERYVTLEAWPNAEVCHGAPEPKLKT